MEFGVVGAAGGGDDHGKGQEPGKSLVQDHDKESRPRAAR